MSKRVEEMALKAYPKDRKGVLYDLARRSIVQGYEQAEKDLALTWEDIKKINSLSMEVTTLFVSVGRNKDILERPFYEEVARRFNEQRKK